MILFWVFNLVMFLRNIWIQLQWLGILWLDAMYPALPTMLEQFYMMHISSMPCPNMSLQCIHEHRMHWYAIHPLKRNVFSAHLSHSHLTCRVPPWCSWYFYIRQLCNTKSAVRLRSRLWPFLPLLYRYTQIWYNPPHRV